MTQLKRLARRTQDKVLRGNDPLWRYVFNASATLDFRRRHPVLNEPATAFLEDLRRDGAAATDLGTLTGDPHLLGQLQEMAAKFEAGAADQIEGMRQRVVQQTTPGKPFLVEMLDPLRPVIRPDDVLARLALQPQLKAIADHYFGLSTVVSGANVWRTLASGESPSSSQLWHRDIPEDRVVLKAFVYLEPVAEGGGPFRYALGTHPRGPIQMKLPGVYDGMNNRVPEGQTTESLDKLSRTFVAPAGTLIFADTLGYHRGGWATTTDRLMLTIRYSSRASTHQSRLEAPPDVDIRPWRHALAYDKRRRATTSV
jgi:hypothetical protein